MTLPGADRLFEALEATWPPAKMSEVGHFIIRDGAGGGKRVSAATQSREGFDPSDLSTAIDRMTSLGQKPIFQIRRGETALDQALEKLGFTIIDPVTVYLAKPEEMADPDLHRLAAIPCARPLAIQREIWGAGGIGPARLEVMERAAEPKTYLLGRQNDRPVGTAFVSLHEGIAVLHALEVHPEGRRLGVGRNLMIGAANWAERHGADWLALLVTDANKAANALYASLGMASIGGYHYRIAPDWTKP